MESSDELTAWFRGHSRWLISRHRSPLYAQLMADAAEDIEAAGVVWRLFDGIDAPHGSMPQLRMMAALHELVLSGRDPALARFYPSAGGTMAPGAVWVPARQALERHFDWIRERLGRTVQTNEPGRAAVLMIVLLWLADRHRLPIRLLEIGASAGLNLRFDSYRYEAGGALLGDPASPVVFSEPWTPGPDLDLADAADALEIVYRAGCDPSPRDPGDRCDRIRLLSYIWPDETDRIDRLRAAFAVATRVPVTVARAHAAAWLPDELRQARPDELTVIWHSVVRQYVEDSEWRALNDAFRDAWRARPGREIVWIGMEPSDYQGGPVELSVRVDPDDPPRRLATCGDHGPPIVWESEGDH